MPLADHFRELRARLIRVLLVLTVAIGVAIYYFHQLFQLIDGPYTHAQRILGHHVDTKAVITGIGGPFVLELKLAALVAIVVTAPYWLYQIWAFILPGLLPNERRWTRIFSAIAGPLFFLGVLVGYWVLPKAIEVLLSFTPGSVQSLVDFNDYFSFMVQILLVFGIAFDIPVFVVLLNLMGVLPASALKQYRPWIIVGIFVFAAVVTPSTDPFTMLALAVPLTALFGIAELVATVVDRRRGRTGTTFDDDLASPI